MYCLLFGDGYDGALARRGQRHHCGLMLWERDDTSPRPACRVSAKVGLVCKANLLTFFAPFWCSSTVFTYKCVTGDIQQRVRFAALGRAAQDLSPARGEQGNGFFSGGPTRQAGEEAPIVWHKPWNSGVNKEFRQGCCHSCLLPHLLVCRYLSGVGLYSTSNPY